MFKPAICGHSKFIHVIGEAINKICIRSCITDLISYVMWLPKTSGSLIFINKTEGAAGHKLGKAAWVILVPFATCNSKNNEKMYWMKRRLFVCHPQWSKIDLINSRKVLISTTLVGLTQHLVNTG